MIRFIELFVKTTLPTIKIDFGTKVFGKAFVLHSIFCLKVMRVFNS